MTDDINDPDPSGHDSLPWVRRDEDGEVFGLGLLPPDPTFVVMAPSYEKSAQPILDDADIRSLWARERKTRRQIFSDPVWITQTNQHTPGSCNGWAGASGMGKTLYLNKSDSEIIILSGSYVYSWINGGHDNGSTLDDGMWELEEHGAPRVSSGATWDKIYRNSTSQYDDEAAQYKGLTMWWTSNKQAFRSGIALGFIGIVCLQWNSNLANWHPSTDKIAPAYSGNGNHAIHCQDGVMLNGTETFDCANSHGPGSGNKGYLNLVWDHFSQPFNIHKFYLIGSAEDHHDAGASQSLLDSIAKQSLVKP